MSALWLMGVSQFIVKVLPETALSICKSISASLNDIYLAQWIITLRFLLSSEVDVAVAAFAVYVQDGMRPLESKLSSSTCHPVRAWLIANAQIQIYENKQPYGQW